MVATNEEEWELKERDKDGLKTLQGAAAPGRQPSVSKQQGKVVDWAQSTVSELWCHFLKEHPQKRDRGYC